MAFALQATSPFRENGLWAIEVLNSELLTEATSDMHTYAEELSAQNDELLHCYAQLMLKKARALVRLTATTFSLVPVTPTCGSPRAGAAEHFVDW